MSVSKTINGITLSGTGESGSSTLSVSAEVNEGLDRLAIFTISTTDNSGTKTTLSVTQEGKREVFNASDGSFLLSDSTTFNTLKS
jgi:hypothetical protein